MKLLASISRELIDLFIDDGSLALAICAVIAFAAIVAALAPDMPIAAGIVLLIGCLGGLLGNVIQRKP